MSKLTLKSFQFFICKYFFNRTILSNEEWKRLPLPSNYKQTSLISLLANFPSAYNKVDTIFSNAKSFKGKSASLGDIYNIKTSGSALSAFGKRDIILYNNN